MAKICEVCNKGTMSGNSVSHSHHNTKRSWIPNVQRIRVLEKSGSVVRKYVCTRCVRSGKVQKAI